MFIHLINIEDAKYSIIGAQLNDELLVWALLSTYDHKQTCMNISGDSYLLAPSRCRMLVVKSVDVWLRCVS